MSSLRLLFFFLSLFIFACAQPKQKIKIPENLLWNNFPRPFKGTILIDNTQIPFKYYPSKDRLVFPLTLMGFVRYHNKTLCLLNYCKQYPIELWRIIKHRLVLPNYKVSSTERGYAIYSSEGNLSVFLRTDRNFHPYEAQICQPSQGCLNIKYLQRVVVVPFYTKRLEISLK